MLNGEPYLLGTHLLASVRAAALKEEIGSLLAHEYEIQRAISRLIFGT
jgi:hypothetical protein